MMRAKSAEDFLAEANRAVAAPTPVQTSESAVVEAAASHEEKLEDGPDHEEKMEAAIPTEPCALFCNV